MTTNYNAQIQTLPVYQEALKEGITIKLVEVEENPITGEIIKVVHGYFRDGKCLCLNTTFVPTRIEDKSLESILIMGLDTARQMGELDFSYLQEELQAYVDAEED